jgi:hypothetical protein
MNSNATGTVIEEKPYPSAPLTMAAPNVRTMSAISWDEISPQAAL